MQFDVVIIGAGIAGASLAAELSMFRSVLIIEQENMPGYHTTGRSAAFWSNIYGGPDIHPLTAASGDFLRMPPPEFAEGTFMEQCGELYIGNASDKMHAAQLLTDFQNKKVDLQKVSETEMQQHIPGLRPEWCHGIFEPSCGNIDVSRLHNAYLKFAKKKGAVLLRNAPLMSASYRAGQWDLCAGGDYFRSAILVNAAGAWADEVALMAGLKRLNIQPYRRTMIQLAVDPVPENTIPLVIALDESFYFKTGIGGKIWLSPHDETASAPCDCAPEEIDVARAIDRFQNVVDWRIVKLERKWAGLRSFAPDRLPVIGRDPANSSFYWLAGQGGFGIQTAPAIAKLAAAEILGHDCDMPGVNSDLYCPSRF